MKDNEKERLPQSVEATIEELNKGKAYMRDWHDRVKSGKEEMDKDKEAEWDKRMSRITDLEQHKIRLEKVEQLKFDEVKEVIENEKKTEKKEKPEFDENKAFEKWLRYGNEPLNDEERKYISSRFMNGIQGRAVTDPQTVTTTGGGYLIPEGFSNQLEKALLYYFPLMEAGTVMPTASGNDLPWPTVNDTSNKGHLLTINTQDTVYNVTFGQVVFYAYMFTSYIVKVPLQLLQDSGVPVEPLLAKLLAERLGRILTQYMTTGTGTDQPQGIVVGSYDSSVSPSATAITRDNILDLKHSVDRAYRDAPGAAFMMHDSTFKAIAKLTFGTSDDRPLWQPSIAAGQPDTIEGKKYFINNEMDEIGANAESIIFGDLKKFMIRRVLGTTLFVYREKYMDYLQIAFQAYSRWDSRMVDAGTHPVKYITHPAS